MIGIVIVALLIRALATVTHPNLIWPDEIYQTVEPARHLVFGPWIRSWEWVVGMRSWLVPGLLAAPLWLGRLVDPTGPTGVTFVTALMVILSLTPVIIGYLWGERLQGLAGGLLVASIAAVWPDLIYMAAHPLIDVFASHLLLSALYLAFPLTTQPSLRRLTAAGVLLCLTLYLRMQLGPAAMAAVAMAAGRSPDRWRAILTGGGLALTALGVFDWITLGTPFQSIWLNFWFNIVGKVSDGYGVQGPLFYISALGLIWGPAIIFALAAVALDYRRHGPLVVVFLLIVATQSMIAHKEWRFIFPALPILTLLIGLRLVDALPRLSAFAAQRGAPRWVGLAGIIALAGAMTVAAGSSPVYPAFWSNRAAMLKAFAGFRRDPGICGVGLLVEPGRDAEQSWVAGPGSLALAPGTPLYIALPADGWKTSASYNAAVIEDGETPPPQFKRVGCAATGTGTPSVPGARTCVYRRPGGCDRTVAKPLLINWPTYFRDAQGHVRRDRIRPTILGLSLPLRRVTQDLTSATVP